MEQRVKSAQVYADACQVMPGGVNSPARAFKGLGITPLIATHGKGDRIWDVDGRSYIDYCGSWGALLLGHAPPSVMAKVQEQLEKGSSFGVTTPVEQEFATYLTKRVPFVEKVRFVSSGTEAVMSVLRLARGITGRPLIVKFNGNYHGHSDQLLMQAGSLLSGFQADPLSQGVPPSLLASTVSLPYNDLPTAKEFLRSQDKIAAVILEPIAGNMGVIPAKKEFLQMLREETARKGILLIFDEVITGFRVDRQGAHHLYGITPDLIAWGKILGGGFPAAAFGGKKELMDALAPLGPVYQAGTLSGNPISLSAGLQTLKEAEEDFFYQNLLQKTESLTLPIQEALAEKKIVATLSQQGSMFSVFWGVTQATCQEDLVSLDKELFGQFFRYLFEQGVYIPPSPYESWFVSSAHTQADLEKTKDLIVEFIKAL